jgi:hypothetical protein
VRCDRRLDTLAHITRHSRQLLAGLGQSSSGGPVKILLEAFML